MANLHFTFASNITENSTVQGPEYLTERIPRLPKILTVVLLLLVGIPGNLITFGYIVYRKWSESATFAVIALLALADFLALTVRGTSMMILDFGSVSLYFSVWRHLGWIAFITINSSNLHVVILAKLRYQLIVYPFKSLTIKPREMVKLSLAAWISSCFIGIPYALYTYYGENFESFEYVFGVFMFLELVVPTVIYHCLKVKRLKEGRQPRQHVIKNMSTVITVIIAMQIIVYSTVMLGIILDRTGRLTTVRDLETAHIVIQSFLLLNHAINPVIYFFSIILYRACPVCFKRRDNVPESREQNDIEAEARM